MEYIFFSSAHGIFFKTDHVLDHKSNFSKLKKIEMIPSIFSNHSGMGLIIKYKEKKTQKSKKHKHMEAKQHTINNQEITEEIKEEKKKTNRNKWQ